jgi:hypothetical protein
LSVFPFVSTTAPEDVTNRIDHLSSQFIDQWLRKSDAAYISDFQHFDASDTDGTAVLERALSNIDRLWTEYKRVPHFYEAYKNADTVISENSYNVRELGERVLPDGAVAMPLAWQDDDFTPSFLVSDTEFILNHYRLYDRVGHSVKIVVSEGQEMNFMDIPPYDKIISWYNQTSTLSHPCGFVIDCARGYLQQWNVDDARIEIEYEGVTGNRTVLLASVYR